ncbi:hypothetical protein ACEQ8H_004556 [Pleosporales sp. CAS-2024a]
MSTLPPPSYTGFQGAVLDPPIKMPVDQQQTYRCATTALARPTLPSGTLKIVVGAGPTVQRTWYLGRGLLAQHSTQLGEMCTNPFRKSITLEDVDVHAFANFVDYMRSSIYALNEQVSGFRRIREGIKACLLGHKLGAKAYSNAAMHSLHMGFQPLAKLTSSNMRLSVIRASDLDLICRNTSHDDDAAGRGLRQLLFDAVASHWSKWEANQLASQNDEHMVEWIDLFVKHEDFKLTMLASCRTSDKRRGKLLKPVHHYLSLDSPAINKHAAAAATTTTESPGAAVIGHGRPASLKMVVGSVKRRSPSMKQRKQRSEVAENKAAEQQASFDIWRDQGETTGDGQVHVVGDQPR